MFKWFISRRMQAFKRAYDYDMSYARDILDADVDEAMMFNGIMPMARYCRDLPRDVWYAAKITAAMTEDCGPCTQLVVKMAEQAGVAAPVLEAVLTDKIAAMPADVALSCRFVEAVLRHNLEADALRQEILRLWGQRGLVTLAFAITSARLLPPLKYALGHGKACIRVRLGSDDVRVERQAA